MVDETGDVFWLRDGGTDENKGRRQSWRGQWRKGSSLSLHYCFSHDYVRKKLDVWRSYHPKTCSTTKLFRNLPKRTFKQECQPTGLSDQLATMLTCYLGFAISAVALAIADVKTRKWFYVPSSFDWSERPHLERVSVRAATNGKSSRRSYPPRNIATLQSDIQHELLL